MRKKIYLTIALALGLQAANPSVVTTTKVYEVPLKYIDNYESMIKEGKLVSSKTKVSAAQNIYRYGDTVIIFPSTDKYKNINYLLGAVKDYASTLKNVDIEKVKRVIDLLKIEGLGGEDIK